VEPLCALYEPRFAEAALPLAQAGCLCPTEILSRLDVRLLEPPPGEFLANANHPEDFARARAVLSGSAHG
jgi:molybdopterin-guanine dinucleotide biosynthesis protein A